MQPFVILRRGVFILCGGLMLVGTSNAFDLIDAYRLAKTEDATYLAAQATADAARELVPQARAGLLPQISASATRSRNDTDQTSPGFLGGITHRQYDYMAKSAALNLRQPLLRLSNVANYSQAKAQVAAAEATLEKDTQTLALRVASAYFNTLIIREKLESVRAQIDAYAGQLAVAERAFATGFGTRTDIDDAKAHFDMTTAQEIEERNNLAGAERTLAGLLNQSISSEALARIDAKRLPLQLPDPDNLNHWISQAEEQNPELHAMRSNMEVAEREVDKWRASHLPTIDLVASRSNSDSDSNTIIGSSYWTSSIGLQLNMPIYVGGQVNSAIQQARANLEKTRQQYEAARRQLGIEVAKQFGAVEQGIARIKALEQALRSAEQAVQSTRKGVQAGTRNSVDVLNTLQQLSAARFELAQARATYSFGWLNLKAAAGVLAEQDVIEVNGWLTPSTVSGKVTR
ncbi:outer membrane protein, protease secretion system [Gammaproteobacteria bacterium]